MTKFICIRCFNVSSTMSQGSSVCLSCADESVCKSFFVEDTRTNYNSTPHALAVLSSVLEKSIQNIERSCPPQNIIKIGIPRRRDAFGWATIKDIQAVLEGQPSVNKIDPNLVVLPIVLPQISAQESDSVFEFKHADLYNIDGLYVPGTYRIHVENHVVPETYKTRGTDQGNFIAQTPVRDKDFDANPFRPFKQDAEDDIYMRARDRYIHAAIVDCIRTNKAILSVCAGTWRQAIAIGGQIEPLMSSVQKRHVRDLSGCPNAHAITFSPKSIGATLLKMSPFERDEIFKRNPNLNFNLSFDLAMAQGIENTNMPQNMHVNSIHWFAVKSWMQDKATDAVSVQNPNRYVAFINGGEHNYAQNHALISGVSPDDGVTEFFEIADVIPGSGRVGPRFGSQFHAESFLPGMVDYDIAPSEQKRFSSNLFAYFLYSAHRWRFARRGSYIH